MFNESEPQADVQERLSCVKGTNLYVRGLLFLVEGMMYDLQLIGRVQRLNVFPLLSIGFSSLYFVFFISLFMSYNKIATLSDIRE